MPAGQFAKDIVGQKFSKLTVKAKAKSVNKRAMWLCECECGGEKTVSGKDLRSGNVKSCGCLKKDGEHLCKKHPSDISKSKFGRLTPIKRVEVDASGYKWLCLCDCGSETVIQRSALTSGAVLSCGCFSADNTRKLGLANATHGHTKGRKLSSSYGSWASMHQRCNRSYDERYGGRGIKVCERWGKFENFLADMGERPAGMTLDRIDVNGNYEPSNCRWADIQTQANNRRGNLIFSYLGVTKTLSQWAKEYSLKPSTLHWRIKRGWGMEKALLTTVEK